LIEAICREDGVLDASGRKPLPSLSRALKTYLPWNLLLDNQQRMRFLAEGQIEWSMSTMADQQRRHLGHWFESDQLRLMKGLSSVRFVTDLGAGDGRMTGSLLQSLISVGSSPREVTLIDRNSKALIVADRRLRDMFGTKLVIEAMCGRFEEMSLSAGNADSTLIMASASLHELPRDMKREFLADIAKRARFFALVELEADHEHFPSGSIVLAWQAATFYDALMADAFSSLTPTSLQSTVGVFLLDELLDIWCNNYFDRHNYHLPMADWIDLLIKADFKVISVDQLQFGHLTTAYVLAESLASQYLPQAQ
jgi:hypothetical protein